LHKFPKTDKVKKILVSSSPSGQSMKIMDANDSVWKTIVTPSTIKAIEGTTIVTLIDNPDFNTDIFTYIISEEKEQKISRTLKVHSKVIVFEDFTETNSPWTFSANKNKSEVVSGVLRCSVKSSQLQKLQKLKIDFRKNYEIEIRFKFLKKITSFRRSYVGIIWGEETKVKYYFITNNGSYNYGSQSNNIETENPYGYSGWDGYSESSDTWIKAVNYNQTGFNTLKIIKTGSKIQYYINNKYVHFENIITNFQNNWAGYGIGNAMAEIDFIRIEQYID
jgi:hypothetical protein